MKTHQIFLFAILLTSVINPARSLESTQLFTSDRSSKALSHPYDGLTDEAIDQFMLGRSFFTIPWVESPAATTARDGLGPLFNANSCASCHRNNGGGASSTLSSTTQGHSLDRSIVLKLVQESNVAKEAMPLKTGFMADPVYGNQLAINGNHDVAFEGRIRVQVEEIPFEYPNGDRLILKKPAFHVTNLNYGALADNTTVNPRRALALTGLGLIDSIPDQQILQRQDEFDENGDGISGKINKVWSIQQQKYSIGRYGWKATTPSVMEQTASALINDMGLTTPWYPQDNCTESQINCRTAYTSAENDVPMHRLIAISDYLRHLQVPVKKNDGSPRGEQLFVQAGCNQCHQNGYQTTEGVEVNPYSDFLLHDMGQPLADSSQMFQAGPTEWRTPPLWGIGLSKKLNSEVGYLHDGRANSLEQAVIWHAGEAETARQKFINLNKTERLQLLSFLKNL